MKGLASDDDPELFPHLKNDDHWNDADLDQSREGTTRKIIPISALNSSRSMVWAAAPPLAVRDHTTDQLGPDQDEFIPLECDEAGENKITLMGHLLDGREYRVGEYEEMKCLESS